MEYVPGISLKKYMKQQQKLFSEQETLTLMQPILSALQAMHQKGILHRDISPENLMLSPDNTLTLIDFGAARTFSRSDDDNLTVILKRGYAPEEQYHSNSRQGPWTDLYAVCAVMYQMLTGILPQEASARAEEDHLTPISRIEEIFEQALQNSHQLLENLDSCLAWGMDREELINSIIHLIPYPSI